MWWLVGSFVAGVLVGFIPPACGIVLSRVEAQRQRFYRAQQAYRGHWSDHGVVTPDLRTPEVLQQGRRPE
jgi:hypothetical protein